MYIATALGVSLELLSLLPLFAYTIPTLPKSPFEPSHFSITFNQETHQLSNIVSSTKWFNPIALYFKIKFQPQREKASLFLFYFLNKDKIVDELFLKLHIN